MTLLLARRILELFYDKNDDGMFVPGDGDCVMNENSGWGNIRVSPLLTVWRRLHVEYDSMGAVKDNTVVAEVQEIVVLEDEEEIVVKLHPGEHLPLEEDRFAGGYLLDNSGARFEILGNTDRQVRLKKSGDSVPQVGTVRLRDDDVLTDGQDVPDLTPTARDGLKEAMAEACVEVLFDIGGHQGNVKFKGNLDLSTEKKSEEEQQFLLDHWNSKDKNRENYWVIYILVGFQGTRREDCDPNTEPCTLGRYFAPGGGAYVFYETTRDLAQKYNLCAEKVERLSLVHEVGHLVTRSESDDITIWDVKTKDPDHPGYRVINEDFYALDFRYTPECLRLIRTATKPWGPEVGNP